MDEEVNTLLSSILIVCRGNICRSPMAEGFIKNWLIEHGSTINVCSAGISALVGYPADINAQKVMKQNGMDISKHCAQLLTDNLVRQSDIIFAMTQSQLNDLGRQFVSAKGKSFLFGHWGGFEIQDPYTQPYEVFEKNFQQIQLAWEHWNTRILS